LNLVHDDDRPAAAAMLRKIRANGYRADPSRVLLMGLLVPLFSMFYSGVAMLARLAGVLLGFVMIASFMVGGRGMVVLGGLMVSLRRIGMML
jgi:hypothetical protein